MKPLILALSFCLLTCFNRANAAPVFCFTATDTSFLVAVEDAFFVSGSGVVVTGTVESGTVLPGMKVEIRGKGDKVFTATVGFISMYTKQVASAKKGDAIALNLKGVNNGEIKRGMLVVAPNTIKSYGQIEISLLLLSADKGGLTSPLQSDQSVQVLSRTETVSAKLITTASLKPGDATTGKLQLAEAIPFRMNDKIVIKHMGKIIGNATVLKMD